MTPSTTDRTTDTPLPCAEERRTLREAKSLSEEQVASVLGVTAATVRAWENGATSPRGRKRRAYARLIGTATVTEPDTGSGPDGGTRTDSDGGGAGRDLAVRISVGDGVVNGTRIGLGLGLGIGLGRPAPGHGPDDASGTVPGTDTEGDTGAATDADDPDGPSPAEAFDALYAHTAPALVRQAYLLTGRRKLAGSAVERAFQLAWQRWPEVAVDRDPAGWVRAVAHEYAMSPWHRVRRAHRRPDAPPAEPARRTLLDALLALPAPYRRTLLLYDGVGLDLPDTAAETEATTPAAAGRLLTARASLTERLPELALAPTPAEESELLRERLSVLARTEPAPALAHAPAVRTDSERRARIWTRTVVAVAALLIGATGYALVTAPRQYEPPQAPGQRVGDVPPRGGPQKLTPQDLALQKHLRSRPAHGPGRLVPDTR
ncbi:helix-turn-helix domain-containing protein [Streptomyces sp. DT171]|uniref:helix-turn-helix domain-containing protein n=1 Tax=Streptomyces sp. DT171 TaxID=3416524 RepID=UPI003CEB0CAE